MDQLREHIRVICEEYSHGIRGQRKPDRAVIHYEFSRLIDYLMTTKDTLDIKEETAIDAFHPLNDLAKIEAVIGGTMEYMVPDGVTPEEHFNNLVDAVVDCIGCNSGSNHKVSMNGSNMLNINLVRLIYFGHMPAPYKPKPVSIYWELFGGVGRIMLGVIAQEKIDTFFGDIVTFQDHKIEFLFALAGLFSVIDSSKVLHRWDKYLTKNTVITFSSFLPSKCRTIESEHGDASYDLLETISAIGGVIDRTIDKSGSSDPSTADMTRMNFFMSVFSAFCVTCAIHIRDQEHVEMFLDMLNLFYTISQIMGQTGQAYISTIKGLEANLTNSIPIATRRIYASMDDSNHVKEIRTLLGSVREMLSTS